MAPESLVWKENTELCAKKVKKWQQKQYLQKCIEMGLTLTWVYLQKSFVMFDTKLGWGYYNLLKQSVVKLVHKLCCAQTFQQDSDPKITVRLVNK